MNDQLEWIARGVAERIAHLLSAQVSVLDERGTVIVSSEPGTGQVRPARPIQEPGTAYLRVPIHVNGSSGELVVDSPANGEGMSPRVAQTLLELLIDQALGLTQLQDQPELKNKFIHDLLRGPLREEEDILREGQILGMDFTRPRAVILINAADYILATPKTEIGDIDIGEAQIRRRAQSVISSIVDFFSLPSDTICAHIGEGEVVVLKASSTQDLFAWADGAEGPNLKNPSWANLTALKRAGTALLSRLRWDTNSAISIGIGRYHPGVLGLARSYRDARAALSLGRRFHGENRVHCLDALGMAAFVGVSDEGTKIDLARHLLSPLDQESDLLDTLRAFFDHNCCPSSTAASLSIHRNTLSYRLDKIASLSGLDARRFDDAVQIRLALLLRTL